MKTISVEDAEIMVNLLRSIKKDLEEKDKTIGKLFYFIKLLGHIGKDGELCWCNEGRKSNCHILFCEQVREAVVGKESNYEIF